MKRIIALLITVAMAATLTACGTSGGKDGGDAPKIESALALLKTVWDGYKEDEKFPAAGGDFSEENMKMDEPGKFGLTDTAALDSTLAVPEASAAQIDDAASLVHMMNANTFTCGVFHMKKADDVSAFADAMKESISTRQWMCGFPDKLVIITVGEYVVSSFGEEEIMNTFKDKVLAAYETAKVVYEEAIE